MIDSKSSLDRNACVVISAKCQIPVSWKFVADVQSNLADTREICMDKMSKTIPRSCPSTFHSSSRNGQLINLLWCEKLVRFEFRSLPS